MLKKMLKSNEKAKANYKAVEATANKMKEEIDKQVNLNSHFCLEKPFDWDQKQLEKQLK